MTERSSAAYMKTKYTGLYVTRRRQNLHTDKPLEGFKFVKLRSAFVKQSAGLFSLFPFLIDVMDEKELVV